MIRISKLTDYATIILSYLTLDNEGVMSATHIARATHLSAPTVSKILKILSESGIVKSYRGTGGGYQLAHLASDITLADIVVAIEGPFAMTECSASLSACALDSLCAVKGNWQLINKIILTALAGVRLSEMVRPLAGHPLTLRDIRVTVEGSK